MVALQERFDYLAKYRRALPEEDFEVAMKAYEWPKKFVSIMKEAATKATAGATVSKHWRVFHMLVGVCKANQSALKTTDSRL